MKKVANYGFLLLALSILFPACKGGMGGNKSRSSSTGWMYNDEKWGGFEKKDYEGQATGPNLVLIEGGTFVMGMSEQDVPMEWDNIPRRVTVSSFYMDETEVSNINYKEYIYWLSRVFGETYPEVVRDARPDTLVWREELSFNEPFVQTYYSHPSYDDYPVVGVNWIQANEFCQWRTDRVNEMILIEKGLIELTEGQKDEKNFNTEAYLAGQFETTNKKPLKNLATGEERNVKFEDGILLPSYRLPTEAEWEYAALALIGNQSGSQDELITDRRIYPWDGNTVRQKLRNKDQGKILANFKRGSGDYMGVAGKLNDHAHIPGPVRSFMPNDFGLYNMAGNVNEWVMDLYRPLTSLALSDVDNHDLNPFRGNKFETNVLDENGAVAEKDSLGRIRKRLVTDEEVADRENYKKGLVYNYLDGDEESEVEYNYGVSTLVSDKSRVIKGGSWADRAYWLSPGSRRFKEEDKCDNTIGFRCAMTRTGGATGNEDAGGNSFKFKKKSQKRRYK